MGHSVQTYFIMFKKQNDYFAKMLLKVICKENKTIVQTVLFNRMICLLFSLAMSFDIKPINNHLSKEGTHLFWLTLEGELTYLK